MGMVHTGLLPFYEKMFALNHHHNWSIYDIENLIPWELDVHTTLLANYIDTVETLRKNREFGNGG
jgi:hypothetical protein